MDYHYYAQRKMVKNGEAITPANYSYTDSNEAEAQYYRLCTTAIVNDGGWDVVSVEWGTIEQGASERKVWTHKVQPEQPEEAAEE